MLGFRRFVLSRIVLQFAFLVGALSANIVESQEWDRFRGPNGSGVIAGNAPAAWTDQELLWKIKLPGQGHSSPVIWGKRIFLMSADETAAQQYVLCVNADDGSVLWQKEFSFSTYHIHTLSSFASTTPAVDAEHVYVAWASPDKTMLMAFDHNGEEVWQRELGEFDSQHGFGTSPIVYGDLVILCKQQKKPDRDGPRTPTSF
ncbi:MAG: PQQ-binding-like beta-propeller repeat protein, partial [Planctomycetales bacterium]|nr:PQQ-binding-like beta-propeller repeat protein [Planctomycetales bacterium]